jgi:hypothetical protein
MRGVTSITPGRASRPWLRVGFAMAYVAAQIALVLTAARRPDAAFGFRMFHESSTIDVHLSRAIDAPSGHGTVNVPVEDGHWAARDREGKTHHLRWQTRVVEPELAIFDAVIHASYGADAQLARWHAALDDVARHFPEDAETRAFVLDVIVRKNGRDPVTVHFESPRP